ncbi:MAG: non-canonical purine NTP pyrophosphatase [Bacillota bacterium]
MSPTHVSPTHVSPTHVSPTHVSPTRIDRVVVAATTNENKLRETAPVLDPALRALSLELRLLDPRAAAVKEDWATFGGNAAAKALAAAAGQGCVALGEDSGLEVQALGGEPGVRSARFSGGGPDENNRLLLERMSRIPAGRREARFRAAVALKVPGGPLFLAQAFTRGEILTEPRGRGGFGYDPVFLSWDLGRSFAEVDPGEKQRVSHRARALRALRGYLFEAFAWLDFPAPEGLVPGHDWCVQALTASGGPDGLLRHSLAVARGCREAAFLLVEAGRPVDPAVASAAGLLHDIGKTPGLAGGPDLPTAAPPGLTLHAWRSGLWARAKGLHPRLARSVTVHGLDSMVSPIHHPRTAEDRILMLCDKVIRLSYVGLRERLEDLRRRHPDIADLIGEAGPRLAELESGLAAQAGLDLALFRERLEAVFTSVTVFPASATAADVETVLLASDGYRAPDGSAEPRAAPRPEGPPG